MAQEAGRPPGLQPCTATLTVPLQSFSHILSVPICKKCRGLLLSELGFSALGLGQTEAEILAAVSFPA